MTKQQTFLADLGAKSRIPARTDFSAGVSFLARLLGLSEWTIRTAARNGEWPSSWASPLKAVAAHFGLEIDEDNDFAMRPMLTEIATLNQEMLHESA